jgi:outer membrane protein assembly factor BamD (BamD/ComL family)
MIGDPKMVKHLLFSLLLLIAVNSCATYKTHHFPESGEKDFHVDFYSKSGEDQLKYAKQFLGEGDYETAGNLFLKIYEKIENDAPIRQEALLNLGNIYSNILYAGRDYEKALFYLEKLLSEFPNSKFRQSAMESIQNIKKIENHKQ